MDDYSSTAPSIDESADHMLRRRLGVHTSRNNVPMTSNLDRFKKDLERLVQEGVLLHTSMLREVSQVEVDKQIAQQIGKEKLADYLKVLPDFKTEYEAWYSEALALLKQLLPDRVPNFVSLYEKPKIGRK